MITNELMERLFPTKGLSARKYNLVKHRAELIAALNKHLPSYKIITYRRVCAFLACCGIETDYFRTTEEYASGADYENRTDLGNTVKGDGRKFKGRGIIQTTGRFNYAKLNPTIGRKIGVDFTRQPEKLNEIEIAVESACIFWNDNNLNKYADAKRIKELNGIVNRGNKNKTPLHWEKRNLLYSKCIRYIPQTFSFSATLNDGGYIIANGDKPVTADSLAVIAGGAIPGIMPQMTTDLDNIDISKLENHYSTATATLQRPSVKVIVKRLLVKIAGGLAFVWSTTGGRIALVLTVAVILFALGGVIYSYRNQIRLGVQHIKSRIWQSLQKETEAK